MNQILEITNINKKQNNNKRKIIKFYSIFIISFFIIIILIIYLINYLFNLHQKDKFAKILGNSFSISSLYNGNSNYNAINSSYNYSNINSPFIIGILRIDKINLNYPILSYSTTESLKISLCRFAGPMPNKIGNLCIAGHNYKNNTFFGKLNYLNYGDKINIYDLNGNMVEYTIFKKAEIDNSYLNCTSQITNGEKLVTLMTCNSLKDTRIIVVAKK